MQKCLLLLLVLVPAGSVSAQRMSGVGTCDSSAMRREIPVGDRPDHSFAVEKNDCSYVKPFEIAGQHSEGGTAVQTTEQNGNTARFRGYYLDRMSGGDTVYYRYEGVATLRTGAPPSAGWRWTILRASGKLQGLTGSGTCKDPYPEGKSRWTCTGVYRRK
jgi:hypothetical protein